jgi:hypothetical protein
LVQARPDLRLALARRRAGAKRRLRAPLFMENISHRQGKNQN